MAETDRTHMSYRQADFHGEEIQTAWAEHAPFLVAIQAGRGSVRGRKRCLSMEKHGEWAHLIPLQVEAGAGWVDCPPSSPPRSAVPPELFPFPSLRSFKEREVGMLKIPKWSGRVVSPVWIASQRKAGSEGRGKGAEREGQHLEMKEGAL